MKYNELNIKLIETKLYLEILELFYYSIFYWKFANYKTKEKDFNENKL